MRSGASFDFSLIDGEVSYRGLGAGSALWLAFRGGLETEGTWIGFVIGLTAAAVLLIARFRRRQKRGFLPEIIREEVARPPV